jgi:cold-inducible RNA-binding protein
VATKLYVGNLAYGVTNTELETMFTPHGTVQSAQVIMDRDTGRSKGFGFVEMGNNNEAQAAINALNGKESDGRTLLNRGDAKKNRTLANLLGLQGFCFQVTSRTPRVMKSRRSYSHLGRHTPTTYLAPILATRLDKIPITGPRHVEALTKRKQRWRVCFRNSG